jgi:hypothetical protein
MSDHDLRWVVEASATQIALKWMLLQWKSLVDESNNALEQQIIYFSADALGEMCATYAILRDATEELRWLIYFKGLIAADTHPRDEMLTAIDAVRRRWADRAAKPSIKSASELRGVVTHETDPVSCSDALAAIERALSKAVSDGR